MNSFKKLCLLAAVKSAAVFFMLLPFGIALWMGRCIGWVGWCLIPRKRAVVYANLKTAFSSERSPSEICDLTKSVFINFAQSFVELLCLPKIKRAGFERFVDLQNKENIDHALKLGRGVILLAIHSGSWELASVVGSVTKRAYHVVANDQPKLPQLDVMLNEYRTIAGAHVIHEGAAAKEIITALHNNEIISLVVDQGGREGQPVPFLGKTASMSTGAIRIAMKYGASVCPVWMERRSLGKHTLKIFPAMSLVSTGNFEKDVTANINQAVSIFEGLLREHPQEYFWFYKVFKHSNQARVVIVDDGRTGHLRQSQSVARSLGVVLKKKGKLVTEDIISLQWRAPWAILVFSLYIFLGQFFGFLRRESFLKYFLTKACFDDLMKLKADFVISCGAQAAGINYLLSRNHLARSIAILMPSLLSLDCFDVVILPEHDRLKAPRKARLIKLKVAPNLIDGAYLKDQSEGLVRHYSHLKNSVRTKFGVLIGGNAKGVVFDESKIRQLINQLKETALYYNADILLTTSRRTPPAIEQLISKELKNFERCSLCIIANQRNIPEAVGGILGLSDLVIVSGESVSMVSEALSSGKSTIVFSAGLQYGDVPRDKYDDFVFKLNEQGYLMITSVKGLSMKIAQLLSRKITLKNLDDQSVIQKALGEIV
ncbi:MAG: mitochondrial fission ELM1 family protein [Candidatus Omnitrophica bacterium]|nr:mitochondrial fission ELM1 family protein [Candidatus Omnitrophota bacterium]